MQIEKMKEGLLFENLLRLCDPAQNKPVISVPSMFPARCYCTLRFFWGVQWMQIEKMKEGLLLENLLRLPSRHLDPECQFCAQILRTNQSDLFQTSTLALALHAVLATTSSQPLASS